MWCTRWYLPLLLLPLPSAPPYFLILFLISITVHAKPCFYCIILLTTLFISTCYWPPISVDILLATPWAQNVTTFADALRATLPSNFTKPIPPVMRPLDRCWCDLGTGGLFEPYNISQWEVISVKKLSSTLEREQLLETAHHEQRPEDELEPNSFYIAGHDGNDDGTELSTVESVSTVASFWSRLNRLARGPTTLLKSEIPPPTPHQEPASTTEHLRPEEATTTNLPSEVQYQPSSRMGDSLIRQEYDLRQYGFGMIVDLRWSR